MPILSKKEMLAHLDKARELMDAERRRIADSDSPFYALPDNFVPLVEVDDMAPFCARMAD